MSDSEFVPEREFDSHAQTRRPVLVWAIAIFYGLSSLLTLATTPILLLGELPVQEALQPEYGPIDAVFRICVGLAGVLFSIQLFRLQRSAYTLCVALLTVTVLASLFHVIANNVLSQPGGATATVGATVGIGILGAILLYVRRLAARAVLA